MSDTKSKTRRKRLNHPCELCDKAFNAPSRLQRHIESVHIRNKTHECEICHKFFSVRDNLLWHKKSVHFKDKSKRYQCDLCDKEYKDPKGLKKHRAIVHAIGEKKHECDLCGRKFFWVSELKIHIKRIHQRAEEKKTLCKFCPLRAPVNSKSKWNQHYKSVHFYCMTCDLKCMNKEEIAEHSKVEHGTEEKCKFCDAIFKAHTFKS